MPYAEVNGQRLYYEVEGEGEPLLCVPGLAMSQLGWILNRPAFAAKHETILFDNRDVGQSSYADSDYEIADMAQDALALAEHLGHETFHLLGVSMGGAIAQEMAIAAPERIRTLTIAVSWCWSGAYARFKTSQWAKEMSRLTLEEQVDNFLPLLFSEAMFENEQVLEQARAMMLANPYPQKVEGFERQVKASGRHETRDRLAGLSMPIHVIGAEYDILLPVWKSQEIASELPEAKYSVMKAAPHGVQVERADEYNNLVLDFIAAHSGATATA